MKQLTPNRPDAGLDVRLSRDQGGGLPWEKHRPEKKVGQRHPDPLRLIPSRNASERRRGRRRRRRRDLINVFPRGEREVTPGEQVGEGHQRSRLAEELLALMVRIEIGLSCPEIAQND